jgi:hypothetical protein
VSPLSLNGDAFSLGEPVVAPKAGKKMIAWMRAR